MKPKKARIAASLALRVLGVQPRVFSTWSRKSSTSDSLRSSTASSSTLLLQGVGGVAEQQLNGVAVSQNGIDGQAFLDWQVVTEESFYEGGEGWVMMFLRGV